MHFRAANIIQYKTNSPYRFAGTVECRLLEETGRQDFCVGDFSIAKSLEIFNTKCQSVIKVKGAGDKMAISHKSGQ